jgi:hypothetical protein
MSNASRHHTQGSLAKLTNGVGSSSNVNGAQQRTLVQTEERYLGSFKYLIRVEVVKKLRSDTFDVIDLSKIGLTEPLVRKKKNLADFSEVGRMAVKRAQLECEKRFCGSPNSFLTVRVH